MLIVVNVITKDGVIDGGEYGGPFLNSLIIEMFCIFYKMQS